MRKYLPSVAGNTALRQRLGADIAQGALSHAYILEGPRGSGKRTLALELAMAAVCSHRTESAYALPCGECPACRKIREGLSPDVIRIARPEDRATMGVESIRALREELAVVPNDLDRKVYIIEDAHTMTVQAQNALLLSLEEPPSFVLFLLLTEDASALLETIRSRAPIRRMQPLDDGTLTAHLCEAAAPTVRNAARSLKESAPAQFAALLKMANGCIGVAEELLDSTKREAMLERRANAERICHLLAARRQNDELLALLIALGTNREELTAQLRTLQLAVRDLALLTRTERAPLCFFTDREEALELSSRFTANRLLAVTDAAERAIAALAANANARLTLMQLLGELIA
ncbi:MAG: hypothetical protein IJA78_06170 [Clostridia bacterium]|nr:hypothetical protein [Clostridia bacterium]